MQRKTIKTIFIVIGSGIAGILLFIVAIIGFAYYKFYLPYSGSGPDFISSSQEIVVTPPEITEKDRFLGFCRIYRGKFSYDRNKVFKETYRIICN